MPTSMASTSISSVAADAQVSETKRSGAAPVGSTRNAIATIGRTMPKIQDSLHRPPPMTTPVKTSRTASSDPREVNEPDSNTPLPKPGSRMANVNPKSAMSSATFLTGSSRVSRAPGSSPSTASLAPNSIASKDASGSTRLMASDGSWNSARYTAVANAERTLAAR